MDTMEIPTDYQQEFLTEVNANESEQLIHFIRIFSDLTNKIRYAAQKRVLVEVALIKLCKPQMEVEQDALLHRLLKLEEALAKGVVVASSERKEETVITEPKEELPMNYPKALPEDIAEVAKQWSQISAKLPSYLRIPLNGVKPSVGSQNELLLVFTESFDKDFIAQEEHIEEIKKIILSQIQKEVEVQTVLASTQKEVNLYPDITKMIKNVPVEFVD